MSEHQRYPESETLETILLHGRPLKDWVDWLSQDEGQVPASRYGRNSEDCAYWAVACEYIYVEANGDDNEPAEALNFYQGLAVNDSDSVLELVREYWWDLPDALKEHLEHEDNGMNMNQQAALDRLCRRYQVTYDPQHYYVYLPNSWITPGYAEGWVGGPDHMPGTERPTIFVGVDPEGWAHS